MNDQNRIARQHIELSRRYFMQLGATGAVGLSCSTLLADQLPESPELAEAIEQLEYLTKAENFRIFGRGKPAPYTISPEKRRAVGLDPETWQLEVTADPESNVKMDRPMTKQAGTALDWDGLMTLAQKHAVRFLKVISCTNVGQPCGMGLWEGVPMRNVIWMARPVSNIRRVFFYGYHNDDPAQRFQSSLPIGRVLEDPPGEHPVILCYKLNDNWLAPENGAPVRVIVPDAYGNKSVKWLQHIVLTNTPQSNDTYAEWNNDTVSHTKTHARFIHVPRTVKTGVPVPITGLVQVGMSGISKVQYCVLPADESWPTDDPYFSRAPWQDAACLPPPSDWGGGLPDGKLPPVPRQFDTTTGNPQSWPLRDTIAHWAALIPGLEQGTFTLRCRTIDAEGVAQPMPRPFLKSGRNVIHERPLIVVANN